MLKPLINVIVPVYNVEQYLCKCIDSILLQTYTNLRVILINDGSTDRCPEICDNYAKQDNRVTVIHQPNGGVSAARNSGLVYLSNNKLSGDYLTFVDSDDYVANDYIEFLYKLLHNNNSDIAQCGHYIKFSEKRMKNKNTSRITRVFDTKSAIESLCYNGEYDITLWNKIYKLSFFDGIRFPRERIYEDTAISYIVAEKAKYFAINMTPKYYYTQRYDSIANGIVWKEQKNHLIKAGDEMANYIEQYYPELTHAANAKKVFVRLSTLSQMVNCGHYDKVYASEIRTVIKQHSLGVLFNKKVLKRDKLGIISIIIGFSFYCIIWNVYYKILRRR